MVVKQQAICVIGEEGAEKRSGGHWCEAFLKEGGHERARSLRDSEGLHKKNVERAKA